MEDDILYKNGEASSTFYIQKQYTIDMEKVLQGNTEDKLNALFSIISGLNFTVLESALTDTLKQFVKEI